MTELRVLLRHPVPAMTAVLTLGSTALVGILARRGSPDAMALLDVLASSVLVTLGALVAEGA